jgi:hypothetical protein
MDGLVQLVLLVPLAKSEHLDQLDPLEDPEEMVFPEVPALKGKLEIPVLMEHLAKMDSMAPQALNQGQLDQLDPLDRLASTALQEKMVCLVGQVKIKMFAYPSSYTSFY